MRTTLDIDNDVLQAVKQLAAVEGITAGRVLSRLARRGLNNGEPSRESRITMRNGVPVLSTRDEIITMDHIQRLMEEEDL